MPNTIFEAANTGSKHCTATQLYGIWMCALRIWECVCSPVLFQGHLSY